MGKLLVFLSSVLISLLSTEIAFSAPQQCLDPSGAWNYGTGGIAAVCTVGDMYETWNLTAAGVGTNDSISGSVVITSSPGASGCPQANGTYTVCTGISDPSEITGAGTFNVWVEWVPGSGTCSEYQLLLPGPTTTGTGNTGCASMGNPPNGTGWVQNQCLVPQNTGGLGGETVGTGSWSSTNGYITFQNTLSGPEIAGVPDSNYNWQGRTVTVTTTGNSGVPATCLNDPLTNYPPVNYYLGDGSSHDGQDWYNDVLGWLANTPWSVQAYGTERVASPKIPCGEQFTETMTIDCPGGPQQFDQHTVKLLLNATTVSAQRGSGYGSPVNYTYGNPTVGLIAPTVYAPFFTDEFLFRIWMEAELEKFGWSP